MTTPLYRTLDSFARILEVTDLTDRFGNTTDDPAIAHTCVVHVHGPEGHWWHRFSAEEISIYTVH